MGIAQLGCKTTKDGKSVVFPIESGTLREIDGITMGLKDENSLKIQYSEKIESYVKGMDVSEGQIVLVYVRNNNQKKHLRIMYNQDTPIRTRTSALEEIKSEPEMVRKRLFSSKKNLFLSMYLADENLSETTDVTIKLTSWEIKKLRELKEQGIDHGIAIKALDGEYKATIRDIFMFALKQDKIGWFRTLFEDALEVFKDNLLINLSDEELYYISREFRLKLNEYDQQKVKEEGIKNFIVGNIQSLKEESHLMDKDVFKEALPTKELKKKLTHPMNKAAA